MRFTCHVMACLSIMALMMVAVLWHSMINHTVSALVLKGGLLPLSQGSQLKHQSHSKVWHCIFLCRKTIRQHMHGINKTVSLQINCLIYRVKVWTLMGLYHSIQRCLCRWALRVYLPYVCGRERLKLSRQEQFSVLELVFLLFWRWRLLGLLFKVS